jgi:prepilin-type N-terminal cleavage/methylation domain-containing protein
MKNEQGFSLIELLIVVAIIAIIAAIAVPSLLTSRMAANEAGGIEGCRTAGSAEVAYAATNNQQYGLIATLVTGNYLDSRYTAGFNGYTYTEGVDITNAPANTATVPTGFAITGNPVAGVARFTYGIGVDQVVRYLATNTGTAPAGLAAGDGIGKN